MIRTLLALIALFAMTTPVSAMTLVAEVDIQAGDLIRSESNSSVYYYGEDGFRYVFPNEKTYFSWYSNFDNVRWISNTDLGNIQIGGNVTHKPGVKMLKFPSVPAVYAVSAGGTLRELASENIAQELYGANWNQQIDDILESLYTSYTIGNRIDIASQFDPIAEQAQAYSINSDKNLSAFTLIDISDEGYDSATINISANTTVRWLNTSSTAKTATQWDQVWGSGTLQPSEHFTRYFSTSGRWHYYSKDSDRNIFEGVVIVD